MQYETKAELKYVCSLKDKRQVNYDLVAHIHTLLQITSRQALTYWIFLYFAKSKKIFAVQCNHTKHPHYFLCYV